MDVEAMARELLSLYEAEIRPLLAAHSASSAEALEQIAVVLRQALARPSGLSIGFVGASQVGKSSIINALLGGRYVPAGGLGPLTAQATKIDYRDVNALEVRYHASEQIKSLARALRSYLSKRGDLTGAATQEGEEAPAAVEVALDLDLVVGETPAEETAGGRVSVLGEHMFAQVQAMLQRPGDSREQLQALKTLPRVTLLDVVREMLNQPPYGDARLLVPYGDRIREGARRFGRHEVIEESEPREFQRELKIRAAGWLSPLVSKLELRLNNPLLKELSLVDLPGVGNVADAGADVAEAFVARPDSAALVIVFRNNGLTTDVVDILDRAKVFTRLLWGGRHGRPPIRIIVAVTYLDSVAQERFNEALSVGDEPPSPDEIFRQLAQEMRAKVQHDLQRAIEASEAFHDTSINSSLAEREATVKRVLAEAIEVVCVDAKDYLQIVEQQTIGRFVSDEAATNVPKLRGLLYDLARQTAGDRTEAIATAHEELHSSLSSALQVVASTYEQGGGAATAEWVRFRDGLAAAAAPVVTKLGAGRATATQMLREVIPKQIDALCLEAQDNALRKLKALRRHGETLYWPSLNAALKRGGVWEGKKLDYPGNLARALVDVVAAGWEPSIVESVRKVVRGLAKSEVELVDFVCKEARRIDAKLVIDTQIDAQKRILQQQASSCIRWTSERLEDLRDDIQDQLREDVGKPISDACTKCLARGKNRGAGASSRILDEFETSGAAGVREASAKSKTLLMKHYRKLLAELENGYLKEHHDPVTAAIASLTGEELDKARTADLEGRRKVLRKVKVVSGKLEMLISGPQAQS